MIIRYLEYSTLIGEANRFLEERARERKFENYAALRDAHAKGRGYRNWGEYREYLFRKKEAKDYLEKKKRKRRKRRGRKKIGLSPLQFKMDRELDNLFRKDRMTKSELTSTLIMVGDNVF